VSTTAHLKTVIFDADYAIEPIFVINVGRLNLQLLIRVQTFEDVDYAIEHRFVINVGRLNLLL